MELVFLHLSLSLCETVFLLWEVFVHIWVFSKFLEGEAHQASAKLKGSILKFKKKKYFAVFCR